jgi:hypothetical protein
MKREIKDGQGFICKDLEEKIRIWEKLIQHRYPIFADGNDPWYKHIVWYNGEFTETNQNNIQALNEAEFFGENEWTPKAGEWVEVSDNKELWTKRQYLATVNRQYICVVHGGDIHNSSGFNTWLHIRQIKPETITLQEDQEKLRELLNKPNLKIEQFAEALVIGLILGIMIGTRIPRAWLVKKR